METLTNYLESPIVCDYDPDQVLSYLLNNWTNITNDKITDADIYLKVLDLLEGGCDPNNNQHPNELKPLSGYSSEYGIKAISNKDYKRKILSHLLNIGADPNHRHLNNFGDYQHTLLMALVLEGDVELIKILLKFKPNPLILDDSPLKMGNAINFAKIALENPLIFRGSLYAFCGSTDDYEKIHKLLIDNYNQYVSQ